MWENDVRTFPDACSWESSLRPRKCPQPPRAWSALAAGACRVTPGVGRSRCPQAAPLGPGLAFPLLWRARPGLSSGQEGCASGSPADAALTFLVRAVGPGVLRADRCGACLWRTPSGSRRARRLGFRCQKQDSFWRQLRAPSVDCLDEMICCGLLRGRESFLLGEAALLGF